MKTLGFVYIGGKSKMKSPPITLLIALCFVFQIEAYQMIEVTGGGTMSGIVTFEGAVPELETFKVDKSKYSDKDIQVCHLEAGTRTLDALLVSQSKGIKDVVVSLIDIQQGKAIPADFRVMSTDEKGQPLELPKGSEGTGLWILQQGCRFIPHVAVIPVGRLLEIYNHDGIAHNVHAVGFQNPGFNDQQPGSKKRLRKSGKNFATPEIMELRCDIHNWMSGVIVVADHPYYAVTDPAGKFKIADVPPGDYTIQFWHSKLGAKKQKVTVRAGVDTKVSIVMTAKAKSLK